MPLATWLGCCALSHVPANMRGHPCFREDLWLQHAAAGHQSEDLLCTHHEPLQRILGPAPSQSPPARIYRICHHICISAETFFFFFHSSQLSTGFIWGSQNAQGNSPRASASLSIHICVCARAINLTSASMVLYPHLPQDCTPATALGQAQS